MLSAQTRKIEEVPSILRTSQLGLTSSGITIKVTLKLLSGGAANPIRILTLPTNIGRAVDFRIRPSLYNGLFDSPFLSRHHATIRVERGRVVIEDLGSINGTFVNGISIKSGVPWPVTDGDLLQFGSEDDNTNDATIVAQIFLEDSNEGVLPPKPPLSLSSLIIDEDPFLDRKNFTPSFSEAVEHRIASISQSLSSLGISLRMTLPEGPNQQSKEGILATLDSIENLINQLSRDDHNNQKETSSIITTDPLPTVHQQPTLITTINVIVHFPFHNPLELVPFTNYLECLRDVLLFFSLFNSHLV